MFLRVPLESREAFGAVLYSSCKEEMSNCDETNHITASMLTQTFFTNQQQVFCLWLWFIGLVLSQSVEIKSWSFEAGSAGSLDFGDPRWIITLFHNCILRAKCFWPNAVVSQSSLSGLHHGTSGFVVWQHQHLCLPSTRLFISFHATEMGSGHESDSDIWAVGAKV